jgi:hypothetical protein
MAERQAAERAAGGAEGADWGRVPALVAEKAGAAVAAGVEPGSDAARPVVDELAAAFVRPGEDPADHAWRVALADRRVRGDRPAGGALLAALGHDQRLAARAHGHPGVDAAGGGTAGALRKASTSAAKRLSAIAVKCPRPS